MENENHQDFSIPGNRGIDLLDNPRFNTLLNDFSFMPKSALCNCNGVVVSLLMKKDINVNIQENTNPDGVTDKAPFFPPLVWNSLVHVCDWVEEKNNIKKLLMAKIDCNYIGLCGFNLFHCYIVQSLLVENGFEKLKWWVDKPMVDCNVFVLCIRERPRVKFLHPAQLISKIVSQFPECCCLSRVEKVVSYLVSRGMSCYYLDPKWKCFLRDRKNVYLQERRQKQKRHKKQNVEEDTNTQTYEHYLPTPMMNDIQNINTNQHILYGSSSGVVFRFHASYMDPIIKTHRFQFTNEEIPREIIEKWLLRFEDEWVPREEFVASSGFCNEKYTRDDKKFVELLNGWITIIYPYSRIYMLSSFTLTEKMYEYMCIKMRSRMFNLQSFHRQRDVNETWKEYFLWASYDSISDFVYSSQLEELISQFEIYFNWKTPFLEEHPNIETFVMMNSLTPSVYSIFAHEYDYSMFEVYYLFRKMFLFLRKH